MGSNNVFHADWFENLGLNYLKNHNLVNLTGTLIETNKKHNNSFFCYNSVTKEDNIEELFLK